jgi:hypothetical protein
MSTEVSAGSPRTDETGTTTGDHDGDDTAGDGPQASAARRWWALVRVPVALYAKVYAALFVVSWLSIELLERHPRYPQAPAVFRGTTFLEGWVRWDGNWYQLIVTEGYFFTPGKQSSVAFFPAYPLAMKAADLVLRDVFLSAVVVSLVCGFVAVLLFYRWCSHRTSPATARLAVLVLLLYPYAWYLFGASYADALFLAAAIGAFVLLDRDRPVLAGLLGIVATAARPVGVGVAIGLVAVMLEQRGVVRIPVLERVKADGWRSWRRSPGDPRLDADTDPELDADAGPGPDPDAAAGRRPLQLRLKALRARDLGVLLAPLGLAAWMFYLWRTWGNPLLFAETESAPGWDQSAGFTTWFKVPWLEDLGNLPKAITDTIWPLDVRNYDPWSETLYTLGCTFQAAIVFTALALTPKVLRRFGWGYALYVLSVVAIPLLGSKDFQGTGRYMLAAFPCFVVVAEWLGARDRARRVWLPVSGGLLIVLTSLFARGYYVA